ncbi:MAG: hypothetical protein AB1705_22190 [Verrucomicrobiota bacterium]
MTTLTAPIETETPILADSGSGYRGGQILFANDSRFLETHFSEPLTAYAVGWKDPNNLEETLEFVAPSVEVGRRFEWKKAANAEEFYSETDDERAIGGDFKRVEFTGEDVTDKTINKGLTCIVDLDNVAGANWQQQKTAKLLRRILRNELRRAVTALTAAAVNANKTWDTTAGLNPDQDIKTELIAAADVSGIRPNRVLFGDTAWNKRSIAYEAQDNAGGYAAAGLSAEELATRLAVDKVLVSRERFQSSAGAKSQVVGNKVVMYFAEDGVDTEDPSNIKRFVSPVEGGGRVRVYVQQISAKLVAVTVEHYSKVVVTYTGGIRQLTIS